MGLDQQLADFNAEFLRAAPAGRPALYEAKIEELRATSLSRRPSGLRLVLPISGCLT